MTEEKKEHHIPVMKKEVLEFLNPQKDDFYIDCTFGGGGHSNAILEKGSKVIAIDRDENNKKFAIELQKLYGENLIFINDRFSNIKAILEKYNFILNENFNLTKCKKIKGILYDLGVSSMQIDQAERGFSFQKDGKLDMRMGCNNFSAEDIVNKATQWELADIIYKYGDERFAKKIANAIVKSREEKPIIYTTELADIVKKAVPFYNDKIHPATRTFQAIRIAVNDELQELEKSLDDLCKVLPVGCMVCVITFHSLEDKIVKNIFNKYSKSQSKHFNRNDPEILTSNNNLSSITLKVITKKPILPTQQEINQNIRARSAKMRVVEGI